MWGTEKLGSNNFVYGRFPKTILDRSVNCHHERESWACAPRTPDDVSRATKAVAVKLPHRRRRQTTSCCKDGHHCNDKSEGSAACKASLHPLETMLGPLRDPLTPSLTYVAGSKWPVQTRRLDDLIRATGKLFATKIIDLILETFPAGLCRSRSKKAIDPSIS